MLGGERWHTTWIDPLLRPLASVLTPGFRSRVWIARRQVAAVLCKQDSMAVFQPVRPDAPRLVVPLCMGSESNVSQKVVPCALSAHLPSSPSPRAPSIREKKKSRDEPSGARHILRIANRSTGMSSLDPALHRIAMSRAFYQSESSGKCLSAGDTQNSGFIF